MSHIPLQRVIVRMMFDPDLIEAIYHNAETALAGVDITPEERAWLTDLDSRSYGADAHFTGRALYAVAGEYPVSTAIAVRTGAGLDAFFSSRGLHESVQAGTSLSLAFGCWLVSGAEWLDTRVCETARIERAMASLRRPPRSPSASGFWLGDSVRVVDAAAGAMVILSAVQSQLERHSGRVAEVVLDAQVELDLPSTQPCGQDRLLLEAGPNGQITVEALNEAMGDLLGRARTGCSEAALLACARRHGADPGEDGEIVADLLRDGLLCRVDDNDVK